MGASMILHTKYSKLGKKQYQELTDWYFALPPPPFARGLVWVLEDGGRTLIADKKG